MAHMGWHLLGTHGANSNNKVAIQRVPRTNRLSAPDEGGINLKFIAFRIGMYQSPSDTCIH